jgi:hypothetical protein
MSALRLTIVSSILCLTTLSGCRASAEEGAATTSASSLPCFFHMCISIRGGSTG